MSTSIFLRLLRDEDKAQALAETIAALREGRKLESVVYPVSPVSFRQVPSSPFAYWVSERVQSLFVTLPQFDNETEGRATRCGLGTLDDFRFLRLRWEVRPSELGCEWVTYYHGGVYSPIYDQFPLVVYWKDDGGTIKKFVEQKVGSASRKVQGEDKYFQPGFVFARRTKGFSPKIMPRGGNI